MNNKLQSRELLALTNACGATNLRHNWSRGKMCRSDWTRQDLVASTTACTRRYQTLPPPTKGLARETRGKVDGPGLLLYVSTLIIRIGLNRFAKCKQGLCDMYLINHTAGCIMGDWCYNSMDYTI